MEEIYNILNLCFCWRFLMFQQNQFDEEKINSGKLLWFSFIILNINSLLAIKSLVA